MPLWSRLTSTKIATPRTAPVFPLAQDGNSPPLKSWLRALSIAPYDSLLEVSLLNAVDLTHMDRSGKNQLFSGRKTRLSTLIRDGKDSGKISFSESLVRAKRIRRDAQNTFADFGLETVFLASGFVEGLPVLASAAVGEEGAVSVLPEKGPPVGDSFSYSLNAPIFLLPVEFSSKHESNDIEVRITGKGIFNPTLEMWLESFGIRCDSRQLVASAYSTSRFEPEAAFDMLRSAIPAPTGLSITQGMWLSTFLDVANNLIDPVISSSNEIIEMLACANSSEPSRQQEVKEYRAVQQKKLDEVKLEPLDKRDIEEEFLVADADIDQQKILDYVKRGFSFVVSAPPGTGQLQTVVNLIAQAASEDKKVLVISQSRAETIELFRDLDRLGLSSLAVRTAHVHKENYLRDVCVAGLLRNERMEEPEVRGLQSIIADYKYQLSNHVESLHTVRRRWGCSPYEAMQELAKLTALSPAPQTVVRLKRSVLDTISEAEHSLDAVKATLKRAAALGAFDADITSSPWYGASLRSQKDVERAQELARVLNEDLQAFDQKMKEVARYSQIEQPLTFTQWGSYLVLLQCIRQSLDKFTPDIFERPLEDLIEATASNTWRREHGVEVTSMQRSRLRRVAKEYIRPGVYVTDLHQSLLDVEEQRRSWEEIAASQRNPAIPSGLSELSKVYERLSEEVEELSVTLDDTQAGGDLKALPVDVLLDRLHALSLNDYTLDTLPERTILLEQLQEQGLDEFLKDLLRRNVPEDGVEKELELAWWQSVLEAMISGDDFLAMNDGDTLRRIEAEYRLADSTYIAQGAARLKWNLAQRWKQKIADFPDEAAALRAMLKNGTISAARLWQNAPDLIASVIPFWVVSPYEVASKLPAYSNAFDIVVIMGAENVHDAAALSGIGRSAQVIAFGDLKTGTPHPLSAGVERPEGGEQEAVRLNSVMAGMDKILPTVGLTYSYRNNDMRLVRYLSEKLYGGKLHRLQDSGVFIGASSRFDVEYIKDGTGLPTADSDGVEAVSAEVNRVAELVFEHAKTKPERSLAVISASEKTAVAIAEAVRVQLPNFPSISDFFKDSEEAFVVKSVTQSSGIVRDDVIFSLGFGRTVHGRVMHTFGVFSEENGEQMFGRAVTRARDGLLVVSSLKPEDLDVNRLGGGAKQFYDLLQYHKECNQKIYINDKPRSETGKPAAQTAAKKPATSQGTDPLVADLVVRLKMLGLSAWQNYDGVIDMVVSGGQDVSLLGTGSLLPIALLSDGSEEYRAMTIRERHRQRPEQFERLGWRYMPLWTIDVFGDPQAIAEKIASYLGINIVARNVMSFEAHPSESKPAAEGEDFDIRKLLEESDRRYNEELRLRTGDMDSMEGQPTSSSAAAAGVSIFAQLLAAQQSDSLAQSVIPAGGEDGDA